MNNFNPTQHKLTGIRRGGVSAHVTTATSTIMANNLDEKYVSRYCPSDFILTLTRRCIFCMIVQGKSLSSNKGRKLCVNKRPSPNREDPLV